MKLPPSAARSMQTFHRGKQPAQHQGCSGAAAKSEAQWLAWEPLRDGDECLAWTCTVHGETPVCSSSGQMERRLTINTGYRQPLPSHEMSEIKERWEVFAVLL